MIFGTALKLGKKIAAGIKQKKTLINGVMAAKKIAAQSSYIGTDIRLASLANMPQSQNNSQPMERSDKFQTTLTLEQKIKKIAPPVIGLLLLIAVIRFVFGKR